MRVVVHRGAGAYICGEETALLDSLEGRRGQPRPRPPFPPVQGLYNAPTQVNNVCTIATLPKVLEMGAAEFAKTGVETAPGTAIFSISGNVVRPGNYELELGTPMRELIYEHAGGIADGPEAEGGDPGRLVGAGAVARRDRRPARLRLARRAEDVLRRRVADRRRRPLLHGAARAPLDPVLHARVVREVHAVPRGDALDGADPARRSRRGDGERSDLELLRSINGRILGKVLCALGEFAVYPVSSYLAKWERRVRAHVDQGRCPFAGESSLEGILAPSEQHGAHADTHAEVPA